MTLYGEWIYWAADGRDLYAIAKVPGAFDLLHVNAAGKVNRLLSKRGSRNIIRLIPSPDGKRLAFTDETADSNVWIIHNF